VRDPPVVAVPSLTGHGPRTQDTGHMINNLEGVSPHIYYQVSGDMPLYTRYRNLSSHSDTERHPQRRQTPLLSPHSMTLTALQFTHSCYAKNKDNESPYLSPLCSDRHLCQYLPLYYTPGLIIRPSQSRPRPRNPFVLALITVDSHQLTRSESNPTYCCQALNDSFDLK
jgi:hypothetical protein